MSAINRIAHDLCDLMDDEWSLGRKLYLSEAKKIYDREFKPNIDTPVEAFVRESNRIEGILRDPTPAEIEAHKHFLGKSSITIPDLVHFVCSIRPGAFLRDRVGLDVRVGNHFPPRGGPGIEIELKDLLTRVGVLSPHEVHLHYEDLHPFTDGNGRSGRVLWLWQMKDAPLGFLHTFYYQTLGASR